VTSLDKLKPKVTNSQHSLRQSSIIYNESALTLEKLSILKAWAEVYVASMKNETNVKTDFTTSAAPSCSPGNGEPEKEAEQDEEDFGDFESTRYLFMQTFDSPKFIIFCSPKAREEK
jgi:hypothetical protein